MTKICVMGAGINGVCTSWELAKLGYEVTLLDASSPMGKTSSNSSKLLHGGLRYLAQGHFKLVYESLNARNEWFKIAPHLTKPITIDLQATNRAQHLIYKIGLFFYSLLSPNKPNQHQSLSRQSLLITPYVDGQMDDQKLGLWVLDQAIAAGVKLVTNAHAKPVGSQGDVEVNSKIEHFDWIINCTGPWAEETLQRAQIPYEKGVDLVAGTHIWLDRKIDRGLYAQSPLDERPIFILPYNGGMLIGTTEETLEEPHGSIAPGALDYLIESTNLLIGSTYSADDIKTTYYGIRPIVRQRSSAHKASRESAIEHHERVITLWGGKWTTSLVTARKLTNYLTQLNEGLPPLCNASDDYSTAKSRVAP